MPDRRPLYPALQPYRTGRLKVSALHDIHYEECGTPPRTAYDLSQRWPEASLIIIPDAGHTGTEPGLADAMVRATDFHARNQN